jgi:hypothetical protein
MSDMDERHRIADMLRQAADAIMDPETTLRGTLEFSRPIRPTREEIGKASKGIWAWPDFDRRQTGTLHIWLSGAGDDV